MDSFFTQDWRMFAPDPVRSSKKLWYRYRFAEGNWVEWRDPAEVALQDYQLTRVTYRGQLLWLHHSIVTNLLKKYTAIDSELSDLDLPAAERNVTINSLLVLTPEYQVARRYILDVIRQEIPLAVIREVEFAYVSVSPPEFSRRHQPRSPELHYYVFPPIKFAHGE